VDAVVRVLYLLHNILLEEHPDAQTREVIERLLPQAFASTRARYSSVAEYQFFIGKILHIAEWYFGFTETALRMEDRLAFRMQKRASELEPTNLLYEWAWRFSLSNQSPNDEDAGSLARRILSDDTDYASWLRKKGFPGAYVLEHLEASAKADIERHSRL
jgi:hypothetical protein